MFRPSPSNTPAGGPRFPRSGREEKSDHERKEPRPIAPGLLESGPNGAQDSGVHGLTLPA